MSLHITGLSRSFSTTRVDYNINRIKSLLPTLPKELKDELNSKSIVEYPSLPDLRTNLKANTDLLKDKMGTYIITCQVDNKEYVGQSSNLRRRLRDWSNPNYNPKGVARLARAIKKHGIHNFRVVIVIFPNQVSADLLTLLEQFFFDTLNPEYNHAPIAGSTAGVQHKEGHGKGPKPADFGDRMRKAKGTPVYLYDFNDILLCIFDSMTQASKYRDISRDKVNNLLTDNNPNRSQLGVGYITLIANASNQMPTMTLEQVTELVLRDRLNNPNQHPNKGKKMTEAQREVLATLIEKRK